MQNSGLPKMYHYVRFSQNGSHLNENAYHYRIHGTYIGSDIYLAISASIAQCMPIEIMVTCIIKQSTLSIALFAKLDVHQFVLYCNLWNLIFAKYTTYMIYSDSYIRIYNVFISTQCISIIQFPILIVIIIVGLDSLAQSIKRWPFTSCGIIIVKRCRSG